jgi:hypothetical protein
MLRASAVLVVAICGDGPLPAHERLLIIEIMQRTVTAQTSAQSALLGLRRTRAGAARAQVRVS